MDIVAEDAVADAADIPVAATVVLVRAGDKGVEVLMMRRPDRGSFAGAWVFPGGKIEPDDAVGLRGFEDPVQQEEAVARRAGVRETAEETGLVVSEKDLVTFARWTPPVGIPLRIRTWFFLAAAPAGPITLAEEEAVAAEWVRPQVMLERHAQNALILYPPTWVTLQILGGMLAERGEAADLAALVRLRGREDFETRLRDTPEGTLFLWADDDEYTDGAEGATGSRRHRLQTGALPWDYTRTG